MPGISKMENQNDKMNEMKKLKDGINTRLTIEDNETEINFKEKLGKGCNQCQKRIYVWPNCEIQNLKLMYKETTKDENCCCFHESCQGGDNKGFSKCEIEKEKGFLRREDKVNLNEVLKHCQMTSSPFGTSCNGVNDANKDVACTSDQTVQNESMTLMKSSGTFMNNKNKKEAVDDSLMEDTEELEQNKSEETFIKEFYFSKSNQLEPNVRFKADKKGSLVEEKAGIDEKETEKSLKYELIDSTETSDDKQEDIPCSSLISFPCEKTSQIAEGEEQEQSFGFEAIRIIADTSSFLTDLYWFEGDTSFFDEKSTFLLYQSFQYEGGDLKDVPEELSNNFETDHADSYKLKDDDSWQENKLNMLTGQSSDMQMNAFKSINELSQNESDRSWICFQNNIVSDTLNMQCERISFMDVSLDINIPKSSKSIKCKSKNVFQTSLVFSSSSSCANISVPDKASLETNHVWEIGRLEKPENLQKESCSSSPQDIDVLQEGKEINIPQEWWRVSNSIVSLKKMKHSANFHEMKKGKLNKKRSGRKRPLLKMGCSFKEVKYSMAKKQVDKARKNRPKQNLKKTAKSPLGWYKLCHRKADKNPTEPNTKKHHQASHVWKRPKENGGRNWYQIKKRWLRKHSGSIRIPKKRDPPSSKKSLQTLLRGGKYRQHAGGKSGQGDGERGRARANSGAEGGVFAQQGGASTSGRGSQGSGAGSGGDHPDDHNNRKAREYNGLMSNTNDESDDDDEEKEGELTGRDQYKRGSHHHHKSHTKRASTSAAPENCNLSTSSALPNLPKPVWDESTLIQRQVREKVFHDGSRGLTQTIPLKLVLPPVTTVSQIEKLDAQGHRRDSAPSLTFNAAGASYDPVLTEKMAVPCTAPVTSSMTGKGQKNTNQNDRKHGVISITQLCEIIGYASIDATVPAGLFEQFNICLTKLMHDLSFGLQELNDTPNTGNLTSVPTHAGCNTKHFTNAAHGKRYFTSNTIDSSLSQPADKMNLTPRLYESSSESSASPLSCTVCLLMSSLVTHLSHDRQHTCMQCAQILNLMTQHARDCVAKNRPHQRITSSDLCYKICKKAGWCSENISCDSASFKGKIQKYCDKALGKSSKSPASSNGLETSIIGFGEMESVRDHDGLSSGANSSSHVSLTGNPVALESGGSFPEKSSLSPMGQQARDSDSFASGPLDMAGLPTKNNSLSSLPLTLSQHVTTSNSQLGAVTHPASSIGGKALRTMTRKASYRSATIPQPIEEVSTAAEEELVAAEGQSGQKDTDIRDFIFRRFGPKGTDPYDTQPTFGDKKGYESMPQHNLHDQEQFYSFGNRAVGVPGIGEVVFGNHKQLRLVAGFWEKKREDCERTRTSPPYQHREEGVILSQYKGHFSILRTRYQKHHQWERVVHLGNGMSGKCHLVTDLKTEFKFCCKKVHLLKYAKEEVNIWSELDHPFIVKLYGAIRHGVKIYIFCEFIDGGSLATCIEEQRHLGQRFSHWSAINYFNQLLKILAYLQSKDVLHEDIKADNILLRNGSTYIALTDFGTSRRLCDPKELLHKSPVGSPAHWSPEKAASQGHGFPSDLWAGVCVLIHMLSGDPPWMRRFMKSATILNFIIYSREPPLEDVPQNVQPVMRNLIASGLVKDAGKRPSAETLLNHEAFRILQNIQPERYYSSIGGLSQAALLAKVHDDKSQQILYSAEIATGPYQESAGQAENSRVRVDHEKQEPSSEGKAVAQISEAEQVIPSTIDFQDQERPLKVLRGDGVQSEQDMSDNGRENIPKRFNEASARLPSQNSNAKRAADEAGEKDASNGNKPQQIPDLDALFSSLLMPYESKAFYNDEVPDGAEALKQSTVKQQQLEVYIPELRKESQLPNLSIFGEALSGGSGLGGPSTLMPPSLLETVTENQHSSNEQEGSFMGEGELRVALSSAEAENIVSFILSSESEYTSADLFDQGSYAGLETIKNGGASYETEPCVTPTNPQHCLGAGTHTAFEAPISPQPSSTNLQQRKPYNLKLQLSPTGSGLTVPTPGTGDSSRSNERSSRTAPSRSSLRGPQSHRTPSTGRLSANSASSRLGGSSTSGSRNSPLPFRFNTPGSSSVLEEQNQLLQMLKAEHESLSSSGSELFNEDQEPIQGNDAPDEMAENWQLALSKLQENIEISSLEGHALHLYDENSMQVVLPVHFMETPINKRQLVESISGRMSNLYGHFSLMHMDKSPLKLSNPLEVHKLLVRQLPGPQKGCLCDSCRSQF
ncbi:hypothetical protein EGW08_012052 [Elysia chlorotica]|uniref:Protein kinase domain-containing protein n=1 Tax=Elysia chlorotica TaxID=188477 RepID=A0A3S0ZJ67_ELYCH|nr:hypothetical protein EGW08_012052 [Elysia chlorotica]